MSHELYKRHRPKVLKRVVGNEATVRALRTKLAKGKLPHTILFHGPSGCGKTTLARIVARELKCHGMDLVEQNCASFRGVDSIRDLMRTMNLAPQGGPCRVWILDEVHQLSKDAQNAALKMLEDTPDHVYFLLCTTDPQKLLPTVRTRCTEMPVSALSDKLLDSLVARVARREGFVLGDEAASELTALAQGSARRALVLLDKVRDLPEGKQLRALRVASDEESEAIALCRALLTKRADWRGVAKILRGLQDGEPESIRWAVLGYARAILLGGGKDASRAYTVICAFEQNFYDSKHPGLARACYEAVFGGSR